MRISHICLRFLLCFGLIDTAAQRSEILDSLYKDAKFVGFGAVVYDTSGILFEDGFGFRNVADQLPFTENTFQPVASVSKTVVATALMKAVELGKISLEDPINKHLPFRIVHPRFNAAPITVMHLATHTAGIRDNLKYLLKSYHKRGKKKYELPEFLENYLATDGEWYGKRSFYKEPPGSSYHYSNVGVALLAYIIEEATRIPFTSFCSRYIFQPLQMKHTQWHYDLVPLELQSQLYKRPNKELRPYDLVTFPDGGLTTSPHELGLYMVEMLRGALGKGSILTEESYQEMFMPTFHINDNKKIAIIWEILDSGLIGHTGGDPGVAAFAYFDKSRAKGRILLLNSEVEKKKRIREFRAIWKTLK